MDYRIEPYSPEQADAVVALSLRAWDPVFVSLEASMDADVYRVFYPSGWRVVQETSVRDACSSSDSVWVAVNDQGVLGFAAIRLHRDDRMGEIYMIAVDPVYQGQGIGRALTGFGVEWMKRAGLSIAMVETGGDPGHAAARRTYEHSGFRNLPLARYFKKL